MPHQIRALSRAVSNDRVRYLLAEKITAYLQPLFGPQVQAVARFDGNDFIGVELVRPDISGTLPFVALSGGTREQVAAAVRLAIAELLVADQDGTLPVVFDDAFANSDPNRIARLQRILNLGTRRGLQIIVLTCHSENYNGLGARTVRPETSENNTSLASDIG